MAMAHLGVNMKLGCARSMIGPSLGGKWGPWRQSGCLGPIRLLAEAGLHPGNYDHADF